MSAICNSVQPVDYGHLQIQVKKGLVHRLNRWRINWRTRRQLALLSDHMLKDIGLSRIDAEQEAQKPFWKE